MELIQGRGGGGNYEGGGKGEGRGFSGMRFTHEVGRVSFIFWGERRVLHVGVSVRVSLVIWYGVLSKSRRGIA